MQKSARNLPNVKTVLAGYLNIQDLFKYNSLIFLKDALPKLEETFLKA